MGYCAAAVRAPSRVSTEPVTWSRTDRNRPDRSVTRAAPTIRVQRSSQLAATGVCTTASVSTCSKSRMPLGLGDAVKARDQRPTRDGSGWWAMSWHTPLTQRPRLLGVRAGGTKGQTGRRVGNARGRCPRAYAEGHPVTSGLRWAQVWRGGGLPTGITGLRDRHGARAAAAVPSEARPALGGLAS